MRPGIDGPKTLVILGAARGGTSFVAECAVKLGIDLGRKYGNPKGNGNDVPGEYANYEDLEFATALDDIQSRGKHEDKASNEWRYVRQMVRDRNLAMPIWGFKRPQVIFIIDHLLPVLRNPHIIVVMRDPVAIWTGQQARNINGHAPWQTARNIVGCLMDMAEKPRAPTLVLSFERAKEMPAVTRYMMAKFLGLNPSEEDSCEYLSLASQGTSEAVSQDGSSSEETATSSE